MRNKAGQVRSLVTVLLGLLLLGVAYGTAGFSWPVRAKTLDGTRLRDLARASVRALDVHPVSVHGTRLAQSVGGIVVNHYHVDADQIPLEWLDQARVLDTFFTHKSVGNNILQGMDALQTAHPVSYTIAIQYTGGGADWFTNNDGILHKQVGDNGDPQSKIDGFDQNIRTVGFHVADIAMMKLCPGDILSADSMSGAETWAAYRDMMAALENDYPDVTFVWWTFPTSTEDDDSDLRSKHVEFNTQARAYCAANDCTLFDIADIESHDPDGNPIVDAQGREAMYLGYASDYAHLNDVGSQRVARAMWWLLARIAGWEPGSTVYVPLVEMEPTE